MADNLELSWFGNLLRDGAGDFDGDGERDAVFLGMVFFMGGDLALGVATRYAAPVDLAGSLAKIQQRAHAACGRAGRDPVTVELLAVIW